MVVRACYIYDISKYNNNNKNNYCEQFVCVWDHKSHQGHFRLLASSFNGFYLCVFLWYFYLLNKFMGVISYQTIMNLLTLYNTHFIIA